jgi:hypothetical protein
MPNTQTVLHTLTGPRLARSSLERRSRRPREHRHSLVIPRVQEWRSSRSVMVSMRVASRVHMRQACGWRDGWNGSELNYFVVCSSETPIVLA